MRTRVVVRVFVVVSALSVGAGASSAQAQANADACPNTAHHVNATHTGSSCTTLAADAAQLWSRTLPGPASYPIIAGGKVYITTSNPGQSYGGQLYALDAATGQIAWGPIPLPGTYYYNPMAYEAGRLFVNNFDGTVVAFDGATGSQLWARPTSYFSGEPVATGGVVYLHGGNNAYALDAATGQVLWTSPYLDGDGSALAADGTGVYVNGGCTAYRLSLAGSIVWSHNGGCTGGGGGRSFLSGGLFFSDTGNLIFNASDGTVRGTFSGTPAFDGGNVFLASGSIVFSETAGTLTPRFSTTLPSPITAGPVVANGVVYVGTADAKIYELATTTGAVVTTKALPGVPGGGGQYYAEPSDLGVGNGLLVVPTGATVTAFGGVSPPPPPPSSTTITGRYDGPLTVNAGQSVLVTNAQVVGSITVNPGGALSVVSSQVTGSITATSPKALSVCASVLSGRPAGDIVVTGASAAVRIGDPAAGCANNAVSGQVTLTGNAGVTLGANSVTRDVTVRNSGRGNTTIYGNRIGGVLACQGNNPAPTDAGQPNTAGQKSGQCAAL